MAPAFSLPNLGPTDQWGPDNSKPLLNKQDEPIEFFAPFTKTDRLGKIADWAADPAQVQRNEQHAQRMRTGAFGQRRGGTSDVNAGGYGSGAGAANSLFAYAHAEDEASFSLVDKRPTKTTLGRGGGRGGAGGMARGGRGGFQSGGRGGFNNRGGAAGGPGGRGDHGRGGHQGGGRYGNQGYGRGGRRFGWKDDKPQRMRDASITVKADWQLLEEIEFNRLAKLNLEVGEGDDLESYGFLQYYDRAFDKTSVKLERPLVVVDKVQYNPTASEDAVIQRLSKENAAQIFVTDNVLSMLLCASRTVYPWDMIVTRKGDQLFFDKREGGPFDFLSVNENALEPPMDPEASATGGINTPAALSMEATYINSNFALQVVDAAEGGTLPMEHENPFYNAAQETDPVAPKAYKYRLFDVSTSAEEPVTLVVRSEIDAVMKQVSGEDALVSIKTLNEFDSKAFGAGGAVDWRSKLDTQRGAIVATEMKNNSSKLARWTAQAILAGVDVMKIGFVSRVSPRDAQKHVILATATYKPREFASQMNLNLSNGWGIVRTIVDVCMKQPDGKYILVKDPNKSIMRIYALGQESAEAL